MCKHWSAADLRETNNNHRVNYFPLTCFKLCKSRAHDGWWKKVFALARQAKQPSSPPQACARLNVKRWSYVTSWRRMARSILMTTAIFFSEVHSCAGMTRSAFWLRQRTWAVYCEEIIFWHSWEVSPSQNQLNLISACDKINYGFKVTSFTARRFIGEGFSSAKTRKECLGSLTHPKLKRLCEKKPFSMENYRAEKYN